MSQHSPIDDAWGTTAFLLGHLPTFTNLGYACRSSAWRDASWDFSGRRWLVTGASAGIGRQIAHTAADAGATVIAAARRIDPLLALAGAIRPGAGVVEPAVIDLALKASVDAVIERVASGGPLDVLVNNVGVLLDDPPLTSEGYDVAFATNLLIPYHLTTALRERGLLKADATVITMSSGGMYNVPLSVDNLARQTRGDGVLAYARHKRAQVALNAYWRSHFGSTCEHYVMHPGWVDTPGVERSLPLFQLIMKPLLRNASAGADTALWLAQMRPVQPTAEGVWFDRKLRPVHVLAATRSGASDTQLVQFLASEVAR